MPETANAQFWVSAGFKPSSDAQHITAYCSTSDADPASGQLSPVATEYWDEIVACKVTTSSGQVVAHDPIHCAIPSEGNGEGAEVGLDALPQTATCTFNIQVQFGVTYFVNSWHYIYLSSTETPADQCFYRISEFVQVDWCVSDPQGYSNWPVSQGLNAEDPSLYKNYSSKESSLTMKITGSMAGTGVPKLFQITQENGQDFCLSGCPFYAGLAALTVQYTPTSAAITDTSNIMDGNVTVNLTAPSGTTGDLNLIFNGSDASGQVLSQAPFTALAPGSQKLQLPFDDILPGIYTMADGSWDALLPGASTSQTVTVPDYTLPTPWTYFRKIFYTQYNIPHESACAGGDEDAWIVSTSVVKGKTTCNFKKMKLNSQFIAATWMNGTGVSEEYGTLKNAAAVNLGDTQSCAGQYPRGAIGHSPADGNTFAVVSSVIGSCNTALVADQSLAMPCIQTGKQCPTAILSGVQALSCGDLLNLDSGDYTRASTRTVDDLCSYCSKSFTFSGADGHIDAYSPSQSCTGGAVGTLGSFYTSYPTN